MGAAAAGSAGVHGFPPALTNFVGRADAVSDVCGLLEEHRLVTVTGPGGMGKTRLAGEVARSVAGRFADGVWLAEMARASAPEQVPSVLAAALAVPEVPGVPTTDGLVRALARAQLLLILDNCEHVVDAVAQLCATLLPAADDLRILTTSREHVGIAGEMRYRLAPLTLPGAGEAAAGSDAMAMFADRARLADPQFRLDAGNSPAVARLVERLDGMPLAIELAAARVETLGVPQLLERLDERFSLLAGADRLAPARQQSLRASVDWSYQLLSEPERLVFRQLSVFPAPFTLEGADAVAGPGAGPVVLRLADCSLLGPPRTGPDGRSRYLMLDTLRAYGADQLAEAGEQPASTATLARYAVRIAEQAGSGLQAGAGELEAARWLDAEEPAVREGLAWTLDHDPAAAWRLVISLAPWWRMRGRLVTAAPLLQRVAGLVEPRGEQWCGVQYWLGHAAHSAGDFAGAAACYSAILEARPGRDLAPVQIDALASRAAALVNVSRVAEGIDDARRAAALARDLGYPAGAVLALLNLSLATYYGGDLAAALDYARQAVAIDPATIPGWITRRGGHFLTMMLYENDELSEAWSRCTDGLARARQAGDPDAQESYLCLMAGVAWQTGRLAEAGAHLHEMLEIGSRTSHPTGLLNGLDHCGHLCAATQRWAEAMTIWAAYRARSQDYDLIDVPMDAKHRAEPLEQASHSLGPVRTRAAQERGAAMSMSTAVDFAIMLTAADQPAPQAGPLSPRERELVTLVARGRTDLQIAGDLFISVRTVRSHLDRIRDKTGLRRRADLTRLALQEGLV